MAPPSGHGYRAVEGFRPPGEGGWIGHWSPGIGDPTLAGWATVVLYFVAAITCFRVGRDKWRTLPRAEFTFYRLLALALAGLGVNKQLDLQTGLTELGRVIAVEQGWYAGRQRVQKAFIVGVALAAVAIAVALLALMRRMPVATHVTILGALALVAFVVIRASSFHHVDLLIRSSWFGVRANLALEMGALFVVLAGASWRARLAGARP
jgi:hypothetical protein